MDDVERLFRRLVDVLATREPGLLQEPIEVTELYQTIIPYRGHRSALRFETNQDYEMALLRLLAGEQGFAEIEPPEARERLAEEARSANPNPGICRTYGDAKVRLNFRAVKEVLAGREAYAPPTLPPQMEKKQKGEKMPLAGPRLPFEFDTGSRLPAPAPPLPAPAACPHCEAALPTARVVVYCPFCGGNVNLRACPQCGTELEADWRHCITCGYRVK